MKARMWVGLFLLGCSVVGMAVSTWSNEGEVRRLLNPAYNYDGAIEEPIKFVCGNGLH